MIYSPFQLFSSNSPQKHATVCLICDKVQERAQNLSQSSSFLHLPSSVYVPYSPAEARVKIEQVFAEYFTLLPNFSALNHKKSSMSPDMEDFFDRSRFDSSYQYAISWTPLTATNQSLRQYAISWTPLTARPLGSFIPLKAASHSRAIAVEQATEASLGTLRAAESLGKCSAKMLR